MKSLYGLIILSAFLFFVNVAVNAQAASGGNFALEQTVIASGGNTNSTGGTYAIAGTIGQIAVGARPSALGFNAQNGFWTAAPLAPTAALASVSGRVTTADGSGIRNALVTLTDASGASRTVLTGKFGAFIFSGIEVGQSIIIGVRAKRFIFAAATQIVFVLEDTSEINFVADGQPVLQRDTILTSDQ